MSLGGLGSSVSNVYFANSSTGYLYGPGFQVTHDGGEDWATGTLTDVAQMTSADGNVFALLQVPDQLPLGLFRTTSDTNQWSQLSLPPSVVELSDLGRVPQDQITGEGNTLLLLEEGFGGSLRTASQVGGLWSSIDGGNTWVARPVPCTPADGGAVTVTIASGHPSAWLIDCFDNEQSQQAQMTQHHLYGTSNGGETWVRLADPADTGDPDQLADNGTGHAFLTVESGGNTQLMGTFDGGRRWSPVLSLGADFQGWSDLQFVSTSTGYVVGPSLHPPDNLYGTSDGGRTWTPIPTTTTSKRSVAATWPTCQTNQLRLLTHPPGFATGQFTQTLTFDNTSHVTCELGGWPGVQAVVDGRAQPTTATRVRQGAPSLPSWVPVQIGPGEMASFNLYGADFDAANNRPCAQTTSGFSVIPPDDTEPIFVAATVQDCGNRFLVAPVIAGSTDNISWTIEVN